MERRRSRRCPVGQHEASCRSHDGASSEPLRHRNCPESAHHLIPEGCSPSPSRWSACLPPVVPQRFSGGSPVHRPGPAAHRLRGHLTSSPSAQPSPLAARNARQPARRPSPAVPRPSSSAPGGLPVLAPNPSTCRTGCCTSKAATCRYRYFANAAERFSKRPADRRTVSPSHTARLAELSAVPRRPNRPQARGSWQHLPDLSQHEETGPLTGAGSVSRSADGMPADPTVVAVRTNPNRDWSPHGGPARLGADPQRGERAGRDGN